MEHVLTFRAAAPAPAQRRPDVGKDDAFHSLMGAANELRAEVQGLIGAFDAFIAANETTDSSLRATKVAKARKRLDNHFDVNSSDIDTLLAEIQATLSSNSSLRRWIGDRNRITSNHWGTVKHIWPPGQDNEPSAVEHATDTRNALEEMAFQISAFTILDRVNERLGNKRLGETLVFTKEFSDEVPNVIFQRRILDELKLQSKLVNGIVKPEEGVIIKASGSPTKRLLSFPLVITVALLPFFLLAINTWVNGFDDLIYKNDQLDDLLRTYFFVLVGAIAHFFVAFWKNRKRDVEPILGEWALWFHIKQGSILFSILVLWAVTFGYGWVIGSPDRETALFIGYSADSIFDVFADRFMAKAESVKKGVLGNITPVPAPGAAPA